MLNEMLVQLCELHDCKTIQVNSMYGFTHITVHIDNNVRISATISGTHTSLTSVIKSCETNESVVTNVMLSNTLEKNTLIENIRER